MNSKSLVTKAIRYACMAGLLCGPALYLLQSIVGTGHLGEAIGGAAVGTAFFSSTAIVGAYSKAQNLKSNMLNAYLVKVSAMVGLFIAVPLGTIDRITVAIALVSSSVVYLGVQTTLLSRRRSSE